MAGLLFDGMEDVEDAAHLNDFFAQQGQPLHGSCQSVCTASRAHDDAVKAQIEGDILQTLPRTLHEEVEFDAARVTSVDRTSYPILTFPEVPEIAIDLVMRQNVAASVVLRN